LTTQVILLVLFASDFVSRFKSHGWFWRSETVGIFF
jgi:hypothetical protein